MTWPRLKHVCEDPQRQYALKHMAPAYTTGPILSWLRGFYNSAFSSWRILLNSTFLKVLKGKTPKFLIKWSLKTPPRIFSVRFFMNGGSRKIQEKQSRAETYPMLSHTKKQFFVWANISKKNLLCRGSLFPKKYWIKPTSLDQKMFWELSVFGHNIGKIDKIVIDRYNYSDGLGLSLETIDKIYLNCPTIFFSILS